MARKSEEVRHLGEKKRPATATAEKEKDTYERDYSRYAFSYPTDQYKYVLKPGLSREVVVEISAVKNEPAWMREFRLAAYEAFLKKPIPTWGGDLSKINFDTITYYATPTDKGARSWDDVPEEVKQTFDRLGIPEAERKFLAGVGAQYDSEVVYHSIREDLAKKGVIFLSMDDGLREYPDLVKEYVGTVIPKEDNKFAALNSAVWSGGSFIYVPKGVRVDIPLQAYFRINAPQMGQFERTLIIADEGSKVHYVEGCTAPVYSRESLHSAVVELIAKRGAHLRYTTLQNWSNDVYNLVTKRAVAYEDATVEWVDANIGCLTADTKVFLNPRGAVNITEIKLNDWVYALDLNSLEIVKRPVKGVVCTGVKPVFKLITENHREIKATANHPFLALQRSEKHWQLVWKPLEQLQVGDFIAIIEELPPEEGKPAEFVRIKALEPLGEELVYDIEVEGVHNFIANGLIVHNSRLTMKYPSVYMLGRGAKADILSVAFAGKGQHQDTGGKAIHAAPYTTSTIVSKSVSKDGGRASYRGQLVVAKGAHHAKSNVRCDALLLDERSRSDTYPYIEIDEDQVTIGHEATVGKVGDDQIFYLQSRGLSESEALSMIVLGFMEPFTKTLPMEYAIEFNRLIQLEMEGSVG